MPLKKNLTIDATCLFFLLNSFFFHFVFHIDLQLRIRVVHPKKKKKKIFVCNNGKHKVSTGGISGATQSPVGMPERLFFFFSKIRRLGRDKNTHNAKISPAEHKRQRDTEIEWIFFFFRHLLKKQKSPWKKSARATPPSSCCSSSSRVHSRRA